MKFNVKTSTVADHPDVVEIDRAISSLSGKLPEIAAGIHAARQMARAVVPETIKERTARLLAGTTPAPDSGRENAAVARLEAREAEIRAALADLTRAKSDAIVKARAEIRAAAEADRATLIEGARKAAAALADAQSLIDAHDLALMRRESPGCLIDEREHVLFYGYRLGHTMPSAAAIRNCIG
ncbi:hypothetical protein [Sphaerotilus sp.]|uniref:hypothetical protein n=1 Tax=Sphaerotilus sp. TaxID=2093942 RepID=UPI002ACDC915|nr:hypothetical protein [Sphaerotilus sp.]MDZ7858645.1 hypothetical protein [Sphaerotilus sp.]